MPTYRVKSPLRLDGDNYKPGDNVELSVKQAKEIGTDVVEPAPPKVAEEKK